MVIKQFFFNKNQRISIEQHRKYLFFAYPIVMVILGYFLYLYNFVYQAPQVNSIIIPLFIVLAVAPAIYRRWNNYLVFANLVFFSAILGVYFLLFTAGGLNAPGLFWIAATPILGIILIGRIGAILSIIMSLGILFFFYYCDKYGINNPFLFVYDFKKELLRNLIAFMFFFFALFIYYTLNEYKHLQIQKEQKEKIDNLLRLIIHDFATPLSIIQMAVNQIQDKTCAIDKLDKIRRSVDNLNDMITQVRSLKSMQDGKQVLNCKPLELKPLIMEIIEDISDKLQSKDLTIKAHLQDNIWINGNYTILKFQILQNFLTNAIKFSTTHDTISLNLFRQADQAVIEIIDHGIGIPADIIPILFAMDIKTSRMGTAGESGTGYGLPIAHAFINELKGRVEVISTTSEQNPTNHGTTFRLHFPLIHLPTN